MSIFFGPHEKEALVLSSPERLPAAERQVFLSSSRAREMVGKGRRRREKNYRAAYGGGTALPPPPDPSQVDALPSKLRRLISFASPPPPPPQGLSSLSLSRANSVVSLCCFC